MACVVRMSSQNCTSAVELFGKDEAGEGVGHREGAEREKKPCPAAGVVAPAIGGADCEDELADALIALFADPGGEGFRSHRLAPAVEEDGDRGRPARTTFEPGKEVRLGPEALGTAG